MIRACLIVLIFYFGFIFQGCAALEYFDGSTKKEIEQFRMTKEEIRNRMEKFKVENVNLQRQVDTLIKEENQRIRDQNENKIAQMRDKDEALNEKTNELEEENKTVSDENQVLAEKLAKLQLQYVALSSKYELEKDIRKLRVKVLSGDGHLNSATEIAKKLENMGYKIRLINYASRSNFSRNTVFFAPKFQDEAHRLVSRLGGNTISKVLSWSSVFDLIIVTGKGSLRIVSRKK